jgi:succinate dehydrogenase / fumarate reductase flavoprotein subunit
VPVPGKHIGLGEMLRAGGARIWSTTASTTNPDSVSEKDRDYFLERGFSDRARSLDASETVRAMCEAGTTFVDLTHLPEAEVDQVAGVTLRTLARLGLGDGARVALPVSAAADRSLGGLWVDHETNTSGKLVLDSTRNHQTSVAGLFAVGECAAQYDGAECLPGNALLSSVFGGQVASRSIANYVQGLSRSAWDLPPSLFEKEEAKERDRLRAITGRQGEPELNPFALRRELGAVLSHSAFVDRSETSLAEVSTALDDLRERCGQAVVSDDSAYENQSLSLAATLDDVLLLCRALLLSARARRETRGVHHRSDASEAQPARHSLVRSGGDEPELVDAFDCGLGDDRRTVTNEVERGAREAT